jgi:flagellar M-ring protein FliF
MEFLKRAQENIGRMWTSLTVTQRAVIGGAAALMVVLLIVSSLSASTPWVRVAGPGGDTGAIVRKLQERGQKHEIRGTEVLVPKEDAERVVVELAAEGAMSDEAIWKFLEDGNPFLDRRQKDLRYKRAMEQKLSSMIRRVEFVKNANVVITLGSESNRIGFEGARAKGSVQVELQDGHQLSNKNVAAIANLVAKAVEGLDPDQVVITDNKLNSYALPKSDGSAALAQTWRDYEREIEVDIRNQIKEAFPVARVVVRITARISKSKTESIKHSNPKVEEEEEKKSIKGSTPSTTGGLKGESVQVPTETTRETNQENRTRNRFDILKEEIENPAGKIEKVTVGVLIPIEVGPDGKELAEAEKQLPKIREWVLAAADAPLNSVSVSFIPSQRPTAAAVVEETPRALAWFAAHWPKLVLGLLIVVAVLMVIRVINRSAAQDTVEELQALTTALTETREAAAELGAPAESELARLRQGIQEMAGRNPQAVAASLKSFMTGR